MIRIDKMEFEMVLDIYVPDLQFVPVLRSSPDILASLVLRKFHLLHYKVNGELLHLLGKVVAIRGKVRVLLRDVVVQAASGECTVSSRYM